MGANYFSMNNEDLRFSVRLGTEQLDFISTYEQCDRDYYQSEHEMTIVVKRFNSEYGFMEQTNFVGSFVNYLDEKIENADISEEERYEEKESQKIEILKLLEDKGYEKFIPYIELFLKTL